jgi:hypothetical protein
MILLTSDFIVACVDQYVPDFEGSNLNPSAAAFLLGHETVVWPKYIVCIGNNSPLAEMVGTRVKALFSSIPTVATCLAPFGFRVVLLPI